MYIEFEGVAGTIGVCLGALGDAVVEALVEAGLLGVVGPSVGLVRRSGLLPGRGGGNGETETVVMDAECPRYDLKDWNVGIDRTCYNHLVSMLGRTEARHAHNVSIMRS